MINRKVRQVVANDLVGLRNVMDQLMEKIPLMLEWLSKRLSPHRCKKKCLAMK